ncbi:MAG TPA: S9 family peptidase, partial [Segatella copri]|nr:S9 family peptidase [Segatella copri]
MNKLILKTTKSGLLAAALMASISASAETIEVKTLKYAGPYAVAQPWMADSVNIKGEVFDLKQLLDSPLSFTLLNKGKEVTVAQLLADKQDALHLASFCVSNTQRTKATIAVEGLEQYRLFVDGEQVAVNGDKAETILTPSQHTVVIKYLTRKNASSDKKSIKLTVTAANGAPLSV